MAKTETKSGAELVKLVAADLDMTATAARKVVESTFQHILSLSRQGYKVRTPIGIFVVQARAARMGTNPASGEPMKIKASKSLKFNASKSAKESL